MAVVEEVTSNDNCGFSSDPDAVLDVDSLMQSDVRKIIMFKRKAHEAGDKYVLE